MNDLAPELESQDNQYLSMLENLAAREGVTPDENGVSNFKVGFGVQVTIYGEGGSPHRGSEGCLANLVGALRQGEVDQTVQVMPDGLKGWTHGPVDEGPSDQKSEADCAAWVEEVCNYKAKSIAA